MEVGKLEIAEEKQNREGRVGEVVSSIVPDQTEWREMIWPQD